MPSTRTRSPPPTSAIQALEPPVVAGDATWEASEAETGFAGGGFGVVWLAATACWRCLERFLCAATAATLAFGAVVVVDVVDVLVVLVVLVVFGEVVVVWVLVVCGETPAPKSCDPAPPAELCLPHFDPEVSPRALLTGKPYCLAAGEPWSTWTPDEGHEEAVATPGNMSTPVSKLTPIKVRIRARPMRFWLPDSTGWRR